jgi:hypothetical protein
MVNPGKSSFFHHKREKEGEAREFIETRTQASGIGIQEVEGKLLRKASHCGA